MAEQHAQTANKKKGKHAPLTPEQKAKRDVERHEKFRQLAIDRVPRALHRIAMLKSLANRQNYNYTEQEAQRVIEVIREAVADMAIAFTNTSTQTAAFTF